MSFPRYPKYKDSGVEWLGEVPEHWEATRAGSLGVFSSSGIDKKLVEGESRVQMFNYLDVYKSNDKVLRYSPDLMTTTAPEDKIVEHSVVDGDLLITPSSETRDDIGHAARVISPPCPVVYSYHVIRFRLASPRIAPYLAYAWNAAPVRAYFEAVCTGTTRKVLVRDDLRNAPLAIPPIAEQAAIAAFLDRETAKIDALIAEQQRLIELLQEKRQAVISHVVTKGLNPDAPMKDSGVEWLGKVPKHWKCSRLKHLIEEGTSISYGIVQPGEPLEEGVPFVQTTNMSSGDFAIESLQKTTAAIANQYPRSTLSGGEVLLGIRASIGATHIAPMTLRGANLSRGVARIVPSGLIASEFLVAALRAGSTATYWQLAQQGSTFNEVSIATVRDLPVLVPPNEEQKEIAERIRRDSAYYEETIATAQRCSALLQERRSALISAAVTGQIDVRGLAGSEAA
jgi:type I restriction enzyme S subunit